MSSSRSSKKAKKQNNLKFTEFRGRSVLFLYGYEKVYRNCQKRLIFHTICLHTLMNDLGQKNQKVRKNHGLGVNATLR